ncbi:MAG TPA: hypothetical protein VFY40_01970 [Blastocatellia bacterium]|nr:hypothetical protein [Blastocatellia bacterium]
MVTFPASPQRAISTENQPTSWQDIFGDFSPFGGVKTVIKATRSLVVRLEQLSPGEEPWSLAELELSEYDYCWLRVWVKRLEPFTVQYCADKNRHFNAGKQRLSFPSGLGALLSLWLSETARRNSVKGKPELQGPQVLTEHFMPEVNELLFSQGNYSMLLREMLQETVRLFGNPIIRRRTTIPNWANDIGLFLADNQSVKSGAEFSVKIVHRPSVRVCYARYQGRAIGVARNSPTSTHIGPLVVTDLNARSLNFHIGLENGDRHCAIRRKLDLTASECVNNFETLR